jgi:signal transduction histidine kinase
MPAVVFHSGSHATGLHSWSYSEFGRMRVEDGKRAERKLDNAIGGMPMILVLKDASASELVDAASQMLRVRETTNQKNFAEYLASEKFRVSVLETDYDSEQAAKMARIAHTITDKTGVFIEKASELFPGFAKTRVGENLTETHRELSGVKSLFQVFSEKGDVAVGVRHKYSNVIGHVASQLAVVQGELMEDILQPPSGKSKEFTKLVDAFEAEVVELYTAFHNYRHLLGKSTAEEEINLVLEARYLFAGIRHNKGTLSFKDEEILVSGPRRDFKTVLEQPAMNAVKFTDPENRKIDVEVSKVKVGELKPKVQQDLQKFGLTSNDDVACVVVRDNGCGIPAENIPKLGRGFTTGGTGIGLALLDTVIKKFRGAWDVESQLGKGTDFYMYFKIAK